MLAFILAAIAVLFVFGFFGLAIGWWTLPAAALLLWLRELAAFTPFTTAIVAVIFIVVAAVFNLPALRRAVITDRILALYRRILPDMSQTEKEAIDAGSVWWDADLFCGKPDWDKLLAVRAPRLSPEEQAFLDGPVEELCAMCDDWQITHELQDLPPQVWQFM